MGTHHKIHLAGGDGFLHPPLVGGGHGTGEQTHTGGITQQLLQAGGVLLRQNFGGSHHGGLPPFTDEGIGDTRRHGGLAAAHVALNQAGHGGIPPHILNAVGNGAALRTRQGEGEMGNKFRGAIGGHHRPVLAAVTPFEA